MDVLVINGRAYELFPNGAPDLHPDMQVIYDYQGNVEENMSWNEETQTFEYDEEKPEDEWLPEVPKEAD